MRYFKISIRQSGVDSILSQPLSVKSSNSGEELKLDSGRRQSKDREEIRLGGSISMN